MTTTNYFNAFIAVADDCPANEAEVPPAKEPKSIARIQYEMLVHSPYEHDSDDVIYSANGERKGISREEFFSKGQPCFRASPLVKRFGWGVHSNDEGKIAIYPVESDEYQSLLRNEALKQLKGMRSKRA